MSLNNKGTYFSSALIVSGILITALTANAQGSLQLTCASNKVQSGLNFILMIGVLLTILPIVQLICVSKCSSCTSYDLKYKWIINGLLLLLGISSAVVWGGIDNNDECNNKTSKNTMIVFTLISFGIITFQGGLFVFQKYNGSVV
jgi:hypothetical protein